MHSQRIRELIKNSVKLSKKINEVGDEEDLYGVGLTSLTTVNLMLSIEDEFEVEFDDSMLSRQTFESISAISDAVEELMD